MAQALRAPPGRVTIYLDYQATTPMAPEAVAAMRPWLEDKFANPHSPHKLGREAAAAVEVAREQILRSLTTPPVRPERSRGARPSEAEGLAVARQGVSTALDTNGFGGKLYFTSGATEAANWALKGSGAKRIVTLATEHACVLDTAEWLAGQGVEVDILPVGPDGVVDLNLAEERITPGTGLVAAMLVNNEIGVIQPVAEIARIARAKGALFFCDAVQGFGRVPLPIEACDMVALSSHKIHGPKGVGALWVREGVRREPFMHGGGQEGGLRSGTLSPALCAGFGAAAALLGGDDVEPLWRIAREMLPDWTVNGSETQRYRGNLNLRRDGVDASRLISEVREVAFSAGSACASGSGRPSHVLAALGLTEREARSSIRLGFGRYTTEEELRTALTLINAAAERQLGRAA
jgi:cysteine desulfurase